MRLVPIITSALICFVACTKQKSFPLPAEAPEIGVTNTGPTPIYVVAGQSNASGGGHADLLTVEQFASPTSSFIFMQGQGDPTLLNVWSSLTPNDGWSLGLIGPEYGFAKSMPQPCYIIKYTVGGTSQDTFWRSPSAGGAFPGYIGLLDAVKSGLASADIPGGAHIAGLIWVQGEADTLDGEAASNYEARTIAFFTDFRSAVSEPDLPVVIGELHPCNWWPYGSFVRAAQIDIPNQLGNVKVAMTEDIPIPDPGNPGNPHFDGPEQYEIGQRIATLMQGEWK